MDALTLFLERHRGRLLQIAAKMLFWPALVFGLVGRKKARLMLANSPHDKGM